MQIAERSKGDRERLRMLAQKASCVVQRDRCLAVVHALRGWETLRIAEALDRSRAFVQRWAYAYRDGGVGAVEAKPRGGSLPTVAGAELERLKARLDAGPRPEDKVCSLRGKDVQRILREESGADLSLSGVYQMLHRMGYACLAPRPRHEKQDLEAQRKFREESAPLLSKRSGKRSSRSRAARGSSSWTRRGSGSRER